MGCFSLTDKANLFIFSIGTKIQCISLRYYNQDTYEVYEAELIEHKNHDNLQCLRKLSSLSSWSELLGVHSQLLLMVADVTL